MSLIKTHSYVLRASTIRASATKNAASYICTTCITCNHINNINESLLNSYIRIRKNRNSIYKRSTNVDYMKSFAYVNRTTSTNTTSTMHNTTHTKLQPTAITSLNTSIKLLHSSITPIEGLSSQKIDNNLLVARMAKEALMLPQFRNKGLFAYLDGPNARTTDIAIKIGIPSHRLMPISIDKNAYDTCLRIAPNSYATHGLMSSVVADDGVDPLINGPFAVLWYDTNCTLSGNHTEKIFPIDDIVRLLRKDFKYLIDGSVLAVTFSRRVGLSKHREYADERAISKKINDILILNGYKPLMRMHNYTRLMSFGLVKLESV